MRKKIEIYLVLILSLSILITLHLIVKIKLRGIIKVEVLNIAKFIKLDKELRWRLKAGYSGIFYVFGQPFNEVNINSVGIRGKENREDLRNKFIMLCLGDSTTFGLGLDIYDTYPYILEQEINAKKLSVLNCGVPGYDFSQIKKYFIKDLIKLNPSLVVVMGGINDTSATRHILYNFIPPYFIRKAIFQYNLLSFLDVLKQNKIKIIFMTIPILGQYKEVDDINKTIRDICNRSNVNLVDTAAVFRKYESKDLYAQIDQVIKIYLHPSKEGNRIIVQELIVEMKKMGIL